jgi:delta14-sterol reductase
MTVESESVWDIVESPSIDGIIIATGYFLSYIFCMFLASRFFPSIEAKSPKKSYQLTGLYIFLTLTILIPIGYYTEYLSLLFIIENFLSFFIVINIFTILFSLYLFQRPEAVRNAPNANRPIDYWHGREKDPMLYGVDLKVFFYQPSLIGLALINLSLAEAQIDFYGALTPGMICYQIFWYFYLLTHYIREDFMLWTFDIIEDHFGFMLVWGDMIYVPFLYSIAGWFAADGFHRPLSIPWLIFTFILYFIGHYIFRESNWQKFDVRKYGSQVKIWGKPAKLLESRLLISGFWGIGRHVNYTGEIMVYLAIALCSGTISIVPYILPVSLFILLSQRAYRDDQRCRKKYGNQIWNQYCQIAKFRMIPFIY